jgi:hypothetical protein
VGYTTKQLQQPQWKQYYASQGYTVPRAKARARAKAKAKTKST